MTQYRRMGLTLASATIIGLAVGVLAQPAIAADAIPFGDARIIIETNATHCDTGIQLIFDADAWKRVKIRDPHGRLMLDEQTRGRLRKYGQPIGEARDVAKIDTLYSGRRKRRHHPVRGLPQDVRCPRR